MCVSLCLSIISSWRVILLRVESLTQTGVAQWVGHHPTNGKAVGLIPGQGTCLGGGFSPQSGYRRGNQLMFLSHIVILSVSLSPSLPLSIKCPQVMI